MTGGFVLQNSREGGAPWCAAPGGATETPRHRDVELELQTLFCLSSVSLCLRGAWSFPSVRLARCCVFVITEAQRRFISVGITGEIAW